MFDEELKYYEQELRDLRTAHNRGLGMIEFSAKSATPSQASSGFPGVYTATVTFADTETFPPIIQFAAEDNSFESNPLGISAPTFDSDNLTATVTISNFNIGSPSPIPTVYAVASIPIVSLEVEARNV